MTKRINYIVKLNKDNIILSVEECNKSMSEVLDIAHTKNEANTDKDTHYVPFFHASTAPAIGKNINEEKRLKGKAPSEESVDSCLADINAAIRILMPIDMTIQYTHNCPLPDVSLEKAHEALEISMMLLVALRVMNDHYKEERAEQKQSVKDLFKDLGLK
jgi:hypothetical protein